MTAQTFQFSLHNRFASHGGSYIPFLDGMRALAIAAVLFFHSRGPLGAFVSGDSGWLGVDVFFVISGFIITLNMISESTKSGTTDLKRFFVFRVCRLMPVFLLWIAATCIVNPKHCTHMLPAALITLGCMADADIANLWGFTIGSGLEIAWSLSIEEKFYMLWAPAFKFCRKHLVAACLIVLAGCFCLRTALVLQHAPWIRFQELPTRLDTLLIGCLAAIASNKPTTQRVIEKLAKNTWLPKIVLLAALAIGFFMGHPSVPKTVTEQLVFWNVRMPLFQLLTAFFMCLLFAQKDDLVEAFLTAPPILWLGKISYSLYLWHMFAFRYIATLPFIQQMTPLTFELLKYGTAICLAALSYYVIERPIVQRKHVVLAWLNKHLNPSTRTVKSLFVDNHGEGFAGWTREKRSEEA
ncbi:MAG TPA: acyltransferase [Oculatellaceae cyanobacterium]